MASLVSDPTYFVYCSGNGIVTQETVFLLRKRHCNSGNNNIA